MNAANNATKRAGAGGVPTVSYHNVTKQFGTFQALAGVSMEVYKGEVVCLIGPSGSGKSTLLRCTNGLETMDGGEIRLDGKALPKNWDGMRQVRQHMGMVFQNFELFPHKTALGNVMAGPLSVLKQSKAVAEERAMALLRKVGLADKANSHPAQLSGGQQQRVAIARAVVTDPTILVADEPTGDLDRHSAEEVLRLMDRLCADLGKTIVMVTHDPRAARKAHIIKYLEKGVLTDAPQIAVPERL